MSRTIKNERTRGFLDKLQKARKERKAVRDQKAENLLLDFDNFSTFEYDYAA